MKKPCDYVSVRVFDGKRPISKEDSERLRLRHAKALSDFTRVCEQTGLSKE